MKSTYDIIIWIFIFLLIALIIGLYISENKRIPKTLYMRTGGSSTPYIEHFEQKSTNIDGYRNSSSFDVVGGASSKYGWGINDFDYERNHLEEVKKEEKKCIQKKDDPMCTKDNIEKNKKSCYTCDILQHPDIDKYVLKSSVPPCPPKVDLNNYIKKSEIPACPKVDLSNYVKKSEIPAQKECPIIQKCPVCPEIPDSLKNVKGVKEVKNTYQFNILDTKNLSNDDIKLLMKDERIKNYLDSEYEEKNNVPKIINKEKSSISEESLLSNSNYNTSSSLWNEIKSLFGFSKEKEENKIVSEENQISKKKNSITSEEQNYIVNNNIISNAGSVSNTSSISNNGNISKSILQEEENKMVYNKDCKDMNFFKQDQSNALGMYAGDSLYASV